MSSSFMRVKGLIYHNFNIFLSLLVLSCFNFSTVEFTFQLFTFFIFVFNHVLVMQGFKIQGGL